MKTLLLNKWDHLQVLILNFNLLDFKVDPETMANWYKRHSSQCIESRSSMAFGSFRKDQDGSEVNLQLQIEYNSKNPTFLPKSTLKAYKFNKHKSSKEPKFHYETWIMKSGSKKLRVPPNLESAFQKRMLRSSVDLRMENKI